MEKFMNAEAMMGARGRENVCMTFLCGGFSLPSFSALVALKRHKELRI